MQANRDPQGHSQTIMAVERALYLRRWPPSQHTHKKIAIEALVAIEVHTAQPTHTRDWGMAGRSFMSISFYGSCVCV